MHGVLDGVLSLSHPSRPLDHDLGWQFIQFSPDLLFTADASGCITWASPSTTEVIGHAPDQVLGRHPVEMAHPEHVDAIAAAVDRVVAGEAQAFEGRMVRSDGEPIWVSVRVRPVVGDDGTVEQIFGILRDITAEVTAREELAASEQRFRVLAENASDAVVQSDAEGVIQWVSPSTEEHFGWHPSDMVGRATLDFIHPDHRERRALGLPTMDGGTSVHSELRIRLPDGSYRWVGITARTIFGQDRAVIGRVTSLRDVQAAVEAREALARSEEHYRLLAANATDAVAHLRDDGTVMWVSPGLTEVLGWDPADWTGRIVDELVHPDDAWLLEQNRMPPEGPEVEVARLRAVAGDGGFRWIEVHRRRYLDDDGRRDGSQVSFRRVDEEVAAVRQLEQLAKFDDLTGLPNRREGRSHLTERLSAGRRQGDQVAVAFCDVDRFKAINDMHGHPAGDAVLQEVAARVRASVRAGDVVARFGGDELLVILDGVADEVHARTVVEKVRLAFTEPVATPAGPLPVTISIGVVVAGPEESAHEVLARADLAMYEVKRTRRAEPR